MFCARLFTEAGSPHQDSSIIFSREGLREAEDVYSSAAVYKLEIKPMQKMVCVSSATNEIAAINFIKLDSN